MDNKPALPEPCEFNNEGVEVVGLPPNTALLQALDQRGVRNFKAHHTQ